MTGISSEFVKKGAERRERQVLMMVIKMTNESDLNNTSGSDHGGCIPCVLGAICCLEYYWGSRLSKGKSTSSMQLRHVASFIALLDVRTASEANY